ncbi:MAG TPA: MBL fold metallo-hydrolase [Vicinamibacteria bacterium]|nr:MBL fold metallo-hydrolase [Vicinamibacteria bacterium]
MTLAFGFLILAAAAGRPLTGETYEMTPVAEGIYAFVAPEPRTGVVQGNCLAIVGDDGVVVVDAGQFPELARRMAADIRNLTAKPVRVLVNTHWHGDHLLANGQLREAFPGLVNVVHAETRRLANKFYSDYGRTAPKRLEGYVKEARAALESGRTKEGKELTQEDRLVEETELRELEAAMARLPEINYAPAEIAFTGEMTLHLGAREVRLMHLGRGNTPGDIVVWVPDAKVVAAGDLVVNPTPYSFGSFHGEWIETLGKLKALGATTIVPGHGPVMRDTAYVDALIDLLGATRTRVAAAVKEGLSLDQTRKRVDLGDFKTRLAGEDLWRRRAFDDFFVAPGIERAYKEAKGEPLE